MKKITWWQKLRLQFFHICPCGGKLIAWELGKWVCNKCPAHYGEGAAGREWQEL